MSDRLFEEMSGGGLGHFGLALAHDAVQGILAHVRQYREEHFARVEAAQFDEQYDDLATQAVLAEVAFSGAAVGALAPLAESLLHRAVRRFRVPRADGGLKDVSSRVRARDDLFWDPSHFFSKRKGVWENDLIPGFRQLLEVLGVLALTEQFDWGPLEALFYYRNRALHEGYEWQPSSRERAAEQIARKGWGRWFAVTTTRLPAAEAEPWLIAVTDGFVGDVLASIEALAGLLRDVERALDAVSR